MEFSDHVFLLVLIPGIPCTLSSWSTWYMSLSPQSQPSTNFAAQHEVGDGERDENCHSLSRPRFDRVITVLTASRTRGLGMAPAGAGTTCMGIQVSCQKAKDSKRQSADCLPSLSRLRFELALHTAREAGRCCPWLPLVYE